MDATPPPGLLGSARAVLAGLVEIGQTRLQLASTDLEEERSLYLAVGARLAIGWRRKARAKPPLLATTFAEFQRNREALVGAPARPT